MTPQEQIDKLVKFILEEVSNEPSRSEGVVDTAIRIIKEQRIALAYVCNTNKIGNKLQEQINKIESELQEQIDKLTKFILEEGVSRLSQSESAIDIAIRIIRERGRKLEEVWERIRQIQTLLKV